MPQQLTPEQWENVCMAMGTRKQVQVPLFLTADDLPEAPTASFFEKLSKVLDQAGFDDFVERVFSRGYVRLPSGSRRTRTSAALQMTSVWQRICPWVSKRRRRSRPAA